MTGRVVGVILAHGSGADEAIMLVVAVVVLWLISKTSKRRSAPAGDDAPAEGDPPGADPDPD